ncbi:MAG: C69 family dipeptidase, partial [Muribaculaceae bacterium]
MNNLTSKTKSLVAAAIVAASSIGAFQADACTSLLVGKNASTDGSTFISYAADSHVLYGALKYQPAADHKPGAMREIYDWDEGMYHGSIPEVAH